LKTAPHVVRDPSCPTTIYVGTEHGLYKSTDGGKTWVAMNTGIGCRDLDAVAIDPNHPTTLYAGGQGGVYKSTDGGLRWHHELSGPGTRSRSLCAIFNPVSTIAVDPHHSETVFAGIRASREEGLYESTDGGRHWSRNAAIGQADVEGITIDPRDSAVLTAVIVRTRTSCRRWTFRSSDGGVSWTSTCRHRIEGCASRWPRSRTRAPLRRASLVAVGEIGGRQVPCSRVDVFHHHIACLGPVASPELVAMGTVLRGEIQAPSHAGEIGGERIHRPRHYVPDQDGVSGSPVALPQLFEVLLTFLWVVRP
jgi:hypothetical protein